MKLKLDGFVISIIVTILLAWFFPQWGSHNSSIPLGTISSIGVSLIFFFYGLKLSPDKLKSGLKNWKLHLLIQLSTFLLFPLLVLPFYPFMQSAQMGNIWLGLLFLAALPSTVSSSVVMVSMARGNIPAAIFNASISGLIGIGLTPLWMGLFMHNTQTEFDLGAIYFKLIVEILLPVVIGISLQKYWGKFALHYGRQLTLFDKSVILLIIYKSFAESFEANIYSSVKPAHFILIAIAVLALFYGVYFLTGYFARLLRFNTEDEITARFCGTKKSLVHGTVFSKILFANSATVGIILLPLMLFHAFQLFVISVYAARYAKRVDGVDK
jgi:solute carrier family 10 (sodium/bile acid cotransporter), member 7